MGSTIEAFSLVLFWSCVAAIGFIYVGYPCVLAIIGLFINRSVHKADWEPSVSIVIAAYNEEEVIDATLANKLALDFPVDKREIIVVSDASTDHTNEIVSTYAGAGVRLLVQPERAGKTAALNVAANAADGEILVFADANSMYRPDTLRKLLRGFSDPRVGYITGRMVYVDQEGSLIGKGSRWFMRYESVLRRLESRVSSVIGVDGGVDAVRRELCRPMDPSMLPDFVLPLRVMAQGFRVVYDDDAIVEEKTLSEVDDEWQMRVRVSLRAFHALWSMRRLFNPFRYGLISFQLIAHKLLRYVVGIFQILALVANALLIGHHHVYAILFIIQVLFYCTAIVGFVPRRRSGDSWRIVGLPTFFCLVNGAALVGLWKFSQGKSQTVWTPRKG